MDTALRWLPVPEDDGNGKGQNTCFVFVRVHGMLYA